MLIVKVGGVLLNAQQAQSMLQKVMATTGQRAVLVMSNG